ncbi:MAG TPA: hypothetical protein VMP00_04580 [Burkholderiales bacterium]|nr:hypothetical protein [Burkholderiales bacterium]
MLHRKLHALPDTMPPRAVWQRIETQARAEGLFGSDGLAPPFRWLAGAGLAATVAATVVIAVLLVPFDGGRETAEVFPTVPAYSEQGSPVNLRTLNALMVESQQLEQDLRSLPEQPHLVRAGTAATISAVEDQVAAIDFRLNESPMRLPHAQMELYWRERVRLMNLLVQLRTAQAQRSSF